MNSNGVGNSENALIPLGTLRPEFEIKSGKESYFKLLNLLKNIVSSNDYLKRTFLKTEIDFDTKARNSLLERLAQSENEIEKQAIREVEEIFDDIFSLDKINPEFSFAFFQIDFNQLYSILFEMSNPLSSEKEQKATFKREIVWGLIKEYFSSCISFLQNCFSIKPELTNGEQVEPAQPTKIKMTPIRKGALVES